MYYLVLHRGPPVAPRDEAVGEGRDVPFVHRDLADDPRAQVLGTRALVVPDALPSPVSRGERDDRSGAHGRED